MPRRVIANIVVTLDGRTTGPGGAGDMSVIAPHGVSDQAREALVRMTDATTVLLGRKNYEGFHGWWPSVAENPQADPRDREFSRWLNTVDKIVFSRTVQSVDWTNARLATAGPEDTVRMLREEAGGDIRVLSSQQIIRQLLRASLVDRLELTVSPSIVGGGGQMLFDADSTVSTWAYSSVTPTDSGALQLVADRIGGADDRTDGMDPAPVGQ